MSEFDSSTRFSRIWRVQQSPVDQAAWEDFVDFYGPRIHVWGRRFTSNEHDLEDLMQAVLLRLVTKLRTFDYDPAKGSFRGWLRTVTRHVWSDLCAARHRIAVSIAGLEAEAGQDLERILESTFDLEVFEEAKRRVQSRVAQPTWQAFQCLRLDGLDGQTTGKRLGIRPDIAYVYASRVEKMIATEVKKLTGEDEDRS